MVAIRLFSVDTANWKRGSQRCICWSYCGNGWSWIANGTHVSLPLVFKGLPSNFIVAHNFFEIKLIPQSYLTYIGFAAAAVHVWRTYNEESVPMIRKVSDSDSAVF